MCRAALSIPSRCETTNSSSEPECGKGVQPPHSVLRLEQALGDRAPHELLQHLEVALRPGRQLAGGVGIDGPVEYRVEQ